MQKIFGYFLRIIVFQLGVDHEKIPHFLIRCFQHITRDNKGPVNPERLRRSKQLLEEFGGQEVVVTPKDERGCVHLMLFKTREFFRHIRDLGGERQGDAIVPRDDASPGAFEVLRQKLAKFFLQTSSDFKRILLPKALRSDDANKPPPIVVHFHSPGRSMAMDRRWIGCHLAAGYDLCISDLRGTIESLGVPSEGGYYLDGEAVLGEVLRQGYSADRIWLSGYCEGAAVAAHLKKKFHEKGVHFVGLNPFSSLWETVRGYNTLGHFVGDLAFPELQAKDKAIQSLVKEDGFDLCAKFQSLPVSSGRFVLIHTDTDKTLPKDSISRIVAAIGKAGPVQTIERRHPEPHRDGHMDPPLEDPAVWNQYVAHVS